MKQMAVIQTIGSITKVEKVTPVEKNVLPNTTVLRNTEPFPGYFFDGNKSGYSGMKLASIYIMLQYRYAPEKILKLSSQIKNQLNIECNAGYGEMNMEGNIFPCIRIKGLKYISSIPQLQNFVKLFGFKFMHNQPMPNEGIIRVYKEFKVLEIDHDLYRDYYEREKYYIRLPIDIDWNLFTILTEKVKSVKFNKNFDAALGELYRFNGPERIVRIFDRDKSLERAKEIKKAFHQELKKELIYN